MAKHKSLKAGGDTVLPVDIANVANQLEWKGWPTLGEVLNAAGVEIMQGGYVVPAVVIGEAHSAVCSLSSIMGWKEGKIPQDIMRRAIKVAADILPQEQES
jgi:hypothetical protein